MRAFILGAGLAAALLFGPARAATVVFDANGFESYTAGLDIVGQHGWEEDAVAGGEVVKPATIQNLGGAAGNALLFDNTQGTGTGDNEAAAVKVAFDDIAPIYDGAVASFDFLRAGAGTANNLWWYPLGANSFYGLQWDQEGGVVVPFGFTDASLSVPVEPNAWMNITTYYNFVDNTSTAYVNGVLIGKDVLAPGAPFEFNGWGFYDQNTVTPGPGRPSGPGERAYIDNLRITALTANDIPEPSSIALLAVGLLPLLRKRK